VDFGATLDAIEAASTNERERFFRALIAEAAPSACERFNGSVDDEHVPTVRNTKPFHSPSSFSKLGPLFVQVTYFGALSAKQVSSCMRPAVATAPS
jgi:hypothetical protein